MNSAQHLWSWLSGKKTYLIALGASIYAWGIAHQLWTNDPMLDTLFAGGALAALRHGWKTEASRIVQAVLLSPPTLPSLQVAPNAQPTGSPAALPTGTLKSGSVNIVTLFALLGAICLCCLPLLMLPGCGKATLESGGAYAPVDTNGVAEVAPDYSFFVVDSGFDLAASTIDGVFKFERENRAALWKVSPSIKHEIDRLRPQVLQVEREYLKARMEYMANPVPANVSTLQGILAKAQQLALSVSAALPPGMLAK